jgi:hypothetical protein
MWAGFLLTAQASPSDVQGAPVFEKEVLPIFETHCVRCHGPKMKLLELDLSTLQDVLEGSESRPVVTPGSVDDNTLYEKISDGLMPADKKTVPSAAEIDLIRRWIEAGASSTETSLGTAAAAGGQLSEHDVIPLMLLHCTPCHGTRTREAELDLLTRASMVKGGKSGPATVPGKPDDSLILKRIRAEANRPALPRRAYLDLTGLPPEPEQVRAFLADPDPKAYEKLIEQLLASDRYGERWGSYWLDVAGYLADSAHTGTR